MKYRTWITITIEHAYFSSGDCGLEIVVSDETAMLMRKTGLIFRKKNNKQWDVLMPEAEPGHLHLTGLFFKDGEQLLTFKLEEKSSAFFYYTDWSGGALQGTGWMIRNDEKSGRSKKCLQIPIIPESADEEKSIEISIPSRQTGWEFILIPKYHNDTYPVELRESKGKLTFSVPEKILFTGEVEAYRCITTSFVTMKGIYDYKISLWQKRDKGELLISNYIPHPKPDSLSILQPKEMITSYFYF